MANDNGVLAFLEVEDGKLTAASLEVLGAARSLNAGAVTGVLLGSGVEAAAQSAIHHGADRVVVADDASLAEYVSDVFVPVAAQVTADVSPAIVLMAQSMVGRDLAPRLAFRLGTAVAMDAVALTAEGGKLSVTRPVYGGNARATYSFNTMPQMATLRAKVAEPLPADTSRSGDVSKATVGAPTALAKHLGRKEVASEGIRLEDAKIVVSGGRGLGGPEGFEVLETLATTLGGAVGASRAACDLGWYPPSQQVGLTGKVVTPDVYIAVAISGASQHMAGCGGSKNIIAINKDAEANIFKMSRFGIVGDYKQVLPALIEEVKKILAS